MYKQGVRTEPMQVSSMFEDIIRVVLTNVPLFLFVTALLLAALTSRQAASKADHFLRWVLLLPVGADALWAGLYHVFAPETAADFIGWQVSPFQFEVGVTDIALGITAIASFWRSLDFRAAVVVYAAIFYVGVVYGHINDALSTGNYAAGNIGILLVLSIIRPLLLVALLWAATRDSRIAARQTAIGAVSELDDF